jgi:rare lipoprotein A
MKTSRSVVVVVNDRGPAIEDRAIDLTRGAAEALGMIERGVAQVRVELLTRTN